MDDLLEQTDMTDDTAETWRPFLGYEGFYEVSSIGRARSLTRMTRGGVRRGRVLSAIPGIGGYLLVRPSVNGQAKTRPIHQLVCEAWYGPRPEGAVVRHLDGNRQNNTPGNLKWGTPAENSEDMLLHGTNWCANKTHCPAGHPYEGDNLALDADGNRKCRACLRQRSRLASAGQGSELYRRRMAKLEQQGPEAIAEMRRRTTEASRKVKARKRAAVAAERAAIGLPPPMKNADKTLCKRGHPLSGDNLCVDKQGRRRCRTCRNADDAERRLRKKQENAAAAA